MSRWAHADDSQPKEMPMSEWPPKSASLLVAGLLVLGGRAMAALPTDFQDQGVVSGLDAPASLGFLPDGRILIVEQKSGNVRLVAGDTLVAGPILTLSDVNTLGGERGLLGVAVDPSWPDRPFVYLYFDRSPGSVIYISRFTAAGDLSQGSSGNLSLGNRYDILVDIPDNASNHNGGTLRFGPDGMLYASVGDDANSCAAQDSTDLRGVILRMNVVALPDTGSGPAPKALITPGDNPFPPAHPNAGLTFCFGLRNPFRFHIDPVTGSLAIGDVGQRDYEELNEAGGGENFGWPFREGPLVRSQTGCTEPGGIGTQVYDDPIGGYDRSAFSPASIIAGPRYRVIPGGRHSFPSPYDGVLFFSDYYRGFIRAIQDRGDMWAPLDSVPGQPNDDDWATGIGTVADFLEGPDGAIYYLKQSSGELRRIVYTGSGSIVEEDLGPVLSVHPNPYRLGEGPLRIDAGQGNVLGTVRVYSVAGELVATLGPGGAGSESTTVTWDGRDRAGRPVRAGVYYLSTGNVVPNAAQIVVLP
jgi:glucose/arabinose dehydrogenase